MLIKKMEQVKVDKNFLDKILQEQTDLKNRVGVLEEDKKKREEGQKILNSIPGSETNQTSDFIIDYQSRYFGKKDLEKEKIVLIEIQEIMKKHRIMNLNINLIRKF